MELFINVMLYLHIAAGMLSLFIAPAAMVTKKGGKYHRLWGKIYFYGMTVVTITAVIISLYRPIPFLLMVAVFSYYAIVSAYRSLYLKKLHKGQKATTLDWGLMVVAAIFSAALLGWGILLFTSANSGQSGLAYVAIAFGSFGLLGVGGNLRQFLRPPKEKYHWFLSHMGGMLGGYIATVTAFAVVNLHFLPPLFRWLGPSAIGIPLIIIWQRYYRRKFEKGKSAKDVSQVNIQTSP